jgi:microcystin degradation protein MlrC
MTAPSKTPTTDDLTTIATFPDPATASLARTAIESAGIPVFLQGEIANSLIPVAFNARLQVRVSDAAAASEILTASDLTPESLEDVTAAEIAGERDLK